MNIKKLIYALTTLAVMITVGLLLKTFVLDSSQNPATLGSSAEKRTFIDDKLGIKFTYSEPLSEQTLSQMDIEDQFIARLTADDPAMLVSIRFEDGLASVATLANTDPLTLVTNNATKALPTRYSNFTQKSQNTIEVAGKQATKIVFEYTGEHEKSVTQSLIFIEIGTGTVVYVASQSESSQYSEAETYFNEISSTISFN